MTNLEELERSILAGARQELGPSATDRMRVQSGLVLTEAWWKPAPLRRSVLRGVARSWRGGVAVGIVLGALLGYGVGRQLSVLGSAVATAPASERVAVTTRVAPAEVAPEAVAAAPELDRALATTGASSSAALPGGSPSRASQAGSLRRAVSRDKGSTLAQELSLLQRARRALNRNDARLALGIVQSLDERFPNGVLMEERSATRILSLCQLERTQEAREQGRRFLADHPRSVYAERVRDSCAGGQ